MFEPLYDIETISGGTHDNVFQCTLVCQENRVEANAANKKEAKRLAAEKMCEIYDIELLETNGEIDFSQQNNYVGLFQVS